MRIRPFVSSDTSALISLFRETVRTINIKDYSTEQTRAWAPDSVDESAWALRFERSFTFVAEEESGFIRFGGFANLEADGHVDMFYVHASRQGCGTGSLLYQAIEAQAQVLGLKRLWVEASITAEPFFRKMGFRVDREQAVVIQCQGRGVELRNFAMSKELD